MENITLTDVWTLILAIASGFVLIANAVEKIANMRRAAQQPNDVQNKRIKALEDWKEEVTRDLQTEKEWRRDIEAGNKAQMHALLALLDHGIDGNNIKQMQDAKKEIQDHLITR